MASLAYPEATQAHQAFILALDVGTSSVRALLFDSTGTAVQPTRAQHSYKLTTSKEGEVSVDADMLVEVVAKTIDETLSAAGPLAAQISAVATDTFWLPSGIALSGSMPLIARSCPCSPGRIPARAAPPRNCARISMKRPSTSRLALHSTRAFGQPGCAGWPQTSRTSSSGQRNGFLSVNTFTAAYLVAPSAAFRWPQAQACS